MGYTAYYSNWTETPETMAAFNAAALDILKAFQVPEADETFMALREEGDPLYDAYQDGQAVRECCRWKLWPAEDGDPLERIHVMGPHEDLLIQNPDYRENEEPFTFTKTARKSYDCLIKALYALAWHHLGGTIDHDEASENYFIECLEDAHPDDYRVFFDVVRRYRLDQVEIGDDKVRPRMPSMDEISNYAAAHAVP